MVYHDTNTDILNHDQSPNFSTHKVRYEQYFDPESLVIHTRLQMKSSEYSRGKNIRVLEFYPSLNALYLNNYNDMKLLKGDKEQTFRFEPADEPGYYYMSCKSRLGRDYAYIVPYSKGGVIHLHTVTREQAYINPDALVSLWKPEGVKYFMFQIKFYQHFEKADTLSLFSENSYIKSLMGADPDTCESFRAYLDHALDGGSTQTWFMIDMHLSSRSTQLDIVPELEEVNEDLYV